MIAVVVPSARGQPLPTAQSHLSRLLYSEPVMKNRQSPPDGHLLGAHMSIARGTPNAIDRALSVQAQALQIFVKNNNRWQGKILTGQETQAFRTRWQDSGLQSLAAHNAYLINLASPNPRLWRKSIEAMLDELDRCRRLGVPLLVTHPGAHTGSGESEGIRRIARALDRIADSSDNQVRIALETTAGQGTCLGHRFEQLRDILGACRRAESSTRICLDSCHLFAAGYDIRRRDGFAEMVESLQSCLGLSKVAWIHLNDSKRELGSRVDRHQHIGQGRIGLEGFRFFMNEPRFHHLPKILETPKEKDLEEDRENLRVLRSLIAAVQPAAAN